MLSRPGALPAGFIAPCLPTSAPQPPSGALWLHEIKHDGFRVIARKDGERVKLYSRPGNDLTHRFPLIVEALALLRSGSCIIDGEAVGGDGARCRHSSQLADNHSARLCRRAVKIEDHLSRCGYRGGHNCSITAPRLPR
jgi:ATP-dependent DNA ligase